MIDEMWSRWGCCMITDPEFTGIDYNETLNTHEELEELEKVNIKALLSVAATVEKMDAKWKKLGGIDCVRRHFDMGFWSEKLSEIGECNTAGCAIGTFIAFNERAASKLGLRIRTYSTPENEYSRFQSEVIFFDINYSIIEYVDMRAVEKAFGLTEEASEYLFLAEGYPLNRTQDALYVAKRIRIYVNAVKKRIVKLKKLLEKETQDAE